MNNVNNGNVIGGSGGSVGGDTWKKPRELRLKNRVKSPVSIKIEDDSDDESIEPKKNGVGNSTEYMEKAVQTDNVFSMETICRSKQQRDFVEQALRRIVRERMQQYETAALKDQCIDKQLSPLLDKLQKENEELRKQGMALKSQLEQKEKEKQTLKRRYGAIENALQSKPSSVSSPSNRPPTYAAAIGSPNNFSNRSPNSMNTNGAMPRPAAPNTNPVVPRMIPPRQIRPPPALHQTNSSFAQSASTNQPAFPPPQINQQRPPVHMVNPVRQVPPAQQIQPMMRHPYAANERFILVNNQMIPASMNGINTQVVASNQGLRMTSMPPDMTMIRPPIDTHARTFTNVAPNMAVSEQYKHLLQRMPVNGIHPQLRPVQNTVRPFTQTMPQQPPSGQNVPNIALPFSPLPKLTANISTSNNAIVLTWDYEKTGENNEQYKVECYQLFAHQAKDARVKPPIDTKQWKKIGVVNALPLPMACTLTQFASGSVYFFAVVAVDIHGREGEMSNPCVIRLDVNR